MEKLGLVTEMRKDRRRGELRRARKAGRVPAVVYGESGNAALYVDGKELRVVLRRIAGGAAIVTLSMGEKKERSVVLAEVQRDPIDDGVLHVDFHEVSMKKKMHAHIPVALIGQEECVGVKAEGGVLEFLTHGLEVRCLPKDLPSGYVLDVSQLQVGQIVHVKDLKPLDGVEFLGSPDLVIAMCAAPKTQTEEKASSAAADGETAGDAAGGPAKEKGKA
ncbi:MAG: 50S ribosomal protein L25 [Puniceicoccales bacterium]|jgi:large subunit ribosomal protein L25|nr:50S ribosomal protein L25 [Puniceicoccales bacterium]